MSGNSKSGTGARANGGSRISPGKSEGKGKASKNLEKHSMTSLMNRTLMSQKQAEQ